LIGGVLLGMFSFSSLILLATIRELMGTYSGWGDVILLVSIAGFLGFLFFNVWAAAIAIALSGLLTYYIHSLPTQSNGPLEE